MRESRRRWPPWRVYAWHVQMLIASRRGVEAEVQLVHLITVLAFSDLDSRPPGKA